jgi:hypothetical protein
MRMRYQAIDQRWRDDARKERDSVVFKCINISGESTQYINFCYALRAFNQVPILFRQYIHCTELVGRS